MLISSSSDENSKRGKIEKLGLSSITTELARTVTDTEAAPESEYSANETVNQMELESEDGKQTLVMLPRMKNGTAKKFYGDEEAESSENEEIITWMLKKKIVKLQAHNDRLTAKWREWRQREGESYKARLKAEIETRKLNGHIDDLEEKFEKINMAGMIAAKVAATWIKKTDEALNNKKTTKMELRRILGAIRKELQAVHMEAIKPQLSQ